ncbi:MAG TPA: hypothetical protein VFW11_20670 [Cyclobacteriaceae bacterium]|nr:hypothetical protein [Cyclobacteriaceae bacterium]
MLHYLFDILVGLSLNFIPAKRKLVFTIVLGSIVLIVAIVTVIGNTTF